jgi:hypothetical protein
MKYLKIRKKCIDVNDSDVSVLIYWEFSIDSVKVILSLCSHIDNIGYETEFERK